ncbi:MAG: prolyl oligopeptidase family serine peptidase, partial [Candidatus Limnocylindrales bacterium]
WTAGDSTGEGRVLLDPNGLSAAGTTSLAEAVVSPSGELVACATSDAGSDWRTWTVRRVATGELLPDRIAWCKFTTVAWVDDDGGFFYERYPEPPPEATHEAPNLDPEIRFHRLGTDAASDPLIFSTPHEPEWAFDPAMSEDGRHLVVTVLRGTDPVTRIYVADLANGPEEAAVRPLLDAADARHLHVATIDGTIYLHTNLGAPLGRVISVAVDDPTNIREVVAECNDVLEDVHLVGGRIAVAYLHHAHSRLEIHELDGSHVADVPLPGIGSIVDMAGRTGDDELFLAYASFQAPASIIAVRMADASVRDAGVRRLPWNPADFVTEHRFVVSADGTRVPLFLTRRRDVTPTGEVPTLLYGYGGFQIPVGPGFRAEWLAWMERGGLLAVASLRGGSEYGKAWHDDGRLANKQHVFDDFAACLRWLAGSGWTRAGRIGISGRSNGGLLVGALLTQHPELFGAAVPEVGVMDMLRFHRFTVGWGWTSDYGCPDDPDEFRWLHAYSPLHNIREGVAYPPTLVTTGDHDDRVVPGHSFKFVAALQAAQRGDAPVLIRIDTDAGHGVGKPVHKQIDERADVLAFLELALEG